MILEHWLDDDGSTCFDADCPHGQRILLTSGPNARKCCEIEGADRDDCLRKYHEHMGWEPYKPGPSTPWQMIPASSVGFQTGV